MKAILRVMASGSNPVWVAGVFLLILAVASALTWAWLNPAQDGALEAPGPGEVIAMGIGEMAKLDDVWGNRSGFIVWSSTMFGPHELVRFEWPSGRLVRLTDHPNVDRSPKISPDGKRVVFARSRQEWVSSRNRDEWDVWVMNLRSRKARRVAEYGAEPTWSPDGKSVVFHRRGRELVQVDLKTGEETVLLGKREGFFWHTPSMDPAGDRVAVTVRGRRNRTSVFSLPDGKEKRVAGGSQLAFAPDGEWLVLVETGGRMKNRISRVARGSRKTEPLLDMPGYWSHEFFPRVSNDGALLVFGAARQGKAHDTADYEIFLWNIGDAPEDAARVSFHTGNDQWPDIWVYPPK